jgi:hypothetical protein
MHLDVWVTGATGDPWHTRSFSSRGIAELVVCYKAAISVILLSFSISILSSLAAEVEFYFSVYKTAFDVFLVMVIPIVMWYVVLANPSINRIPQALTIQVRVSLRLALSLPSKQTPTRMGTVSYPSSRLPRSRRYQQETSPVSSVV